MANRTVFLTGCTGIMGSWVLGEAVLRGYEVFVLMRDGNREAALERVLAVLDHVGIPSELDKIHILLGDARQEHLGLSPKVAEAIREQINLVVHCAACTSFHPGSDGDCWSTNVGGVVNLLEFLKKTDIPFYHVSTAYVAGRRQGRVFEHELDVDQEFNNTYERSKCESEKMVRRAFDEGRLRGSIFRPSIIIGAMSDGRISQFMNFYNVLHLIDMMGNRKGTKWEEIRMEVLPEGTKNLIPVDWTAKALWTIIERVGPSGQVYHLTNPHPLTHEEILTWANKMLRESNIKVRFVEKMTGKLSSFESILMSRLKNYTPYLQHEPEFDRTNTDSVLAEVLPFPKFDTSQFEVLLQFARAQQWRSLFSTRRKSSEPTETSVPYFQTTRAVEKVPKWHKSQADLV